MPHYDIAIVFKVGMFYDIYRMLTYIYALYRLYYNETAENAEWVSACAKRCGAIGTKLLQFLISNDGFFSPECRTKLDFVFEDNDIHAFEHTVRMYELDFGRSIYDDFDVPRSSPWSPPRSSQWSPPRPIGSGTIGQVYKLHHKHLNIDVAVKVKHPNVDNEARSFTQSLIWVLYAVEKVKAIPFSFMLKEFLYNIDLQLDYTEEARQTMIMRKNFESEPHVVIPYIYDHSQHFIIMSYHEGISYKQITDPQLKKHVSIDMYLFMISCLLNYDLIHCDLHVGNWKIALNDDGTYQFIVLDYGLTCSIGDHELSKRVLSAMFVDDFIEIGKVMLLDWENDPRWPSVVQMAEELSLKSCSNYCDRYTILYRTLLGDGMQLNMQAVRMCHGISICIQVMNLTRTNLRKILGKEGHCKEVMLCYNLDLISRINKYTALHETFADWVAEDDSNTVVYENWLEKTFGHKNRDVFIDLTLDGLVL